MRERTPIWSRKPLTAVSFAVVVLVALALFVPTFSAHVAVMNKVSIDATPTDYAVSDDGKLVVEIRVHNPTNAPFTARFGELYGKVNGKQVTGLGVEVEETTVPAGETRTVTARIDIAEGHREEVESAVESGRLSVTGYLKGKIHDADVEVEVSEGETDG